MRVSLLTIGVLAWLVALQQYAVAQTVQLPLEPYAVTGYSFAQITENGRHLGEDVLAVPGTAVQAVADGNIVYSRQDRPGYGQYVIIAHSSPTSFASIYGHLSRQPEWPLRGTGPVKRGDIIGYVGLETENGNWDPHLHFGIYKSAHRAGEYHYWGYAPNDTGDDVDFDINGAAVGGLLTKPSAFIQDWMATQITDLLGNPGLSASVISPDGSTVAFVEFTAASRNTDGKIYIAASNGSGPPIQISPPELIVHADSQHGPAISLSRDLVAFLGCPSDLSCGANQSNLYVIHTDGTGLQQLTSSGGIESGSVKISANGFKILYERADNLYVINSDGTGELPLVSFSGTRPVGGASFNHSGSLVAYSQYDGSSWKLRLIASDGTGNVVVWDNGSCGFVPTLSGDGSTVAFVSQAGPGCGNVFTIKADGTGLTPLEPFMFGGGATGSASITHTGGKVSYDYSLDVVSINADGTHRTNVTNTPSGTDQFGNSLVSRASGMSEDGSVVAFLSNADLDIGMNPDKSFEVFVLGLSPALRINGVTADARPQGGSFTFSGSAFAPNGTVTRHLRQPDGIGIILVPTLPTDSAGSFGWGFATSCATTPGTYRIWAVDDATGRISNLVTETVTQNSECQP